MKSSKKKKSCFVRNRKSFRFFIVIGCMCGFTYQSLQFFHLYWSYPTVVDIQDVSPLLLEMPSFTFCNPVGYNYTAVCLYNFTNAGGTPTTACIPTVLNRYIDDAVCGHHKSLCVGGSTVPKKFRLVLYTKLMRNYMLTPDDYDILGLPLESYLKCTFENAGKHSDCNLTSIRGSFFTKTEMPQFCYSIYSLWGNPEGTREKIAKGTVMHLSFRINTTQTMDPVTNDTSKEIYEPRHNLPASPTIRMSVHSPYFLPSPFKDGYTFLGGRDYDVKLSMKEKHLLPAPYQTDCTDYLKMWKDRGGKGPIDQISAIQECRMNKTYEACGCVPLNLDYPHAYNICKISASNCSVSIKRESSSCFWLENITDECNLESLSQPCDSSTYIVTIENRDIEELYTVNTAFINRYKFKPGPKVEPKREATRATLKERDCKDDRAWSPECGTINIFVHFDRFEISVLTYKPKIESLEIFSNIGGYMGMWLGISLVTIYDLIGALLKGFGTYMSTNKQKSKVKIAKNPSDYYGKNLKMYSNSKKLDNCW